MKKINISILAAFTKDRQIIGKNGKIPWKLPSERDRFKEICKNKLVLMGRKSFEEIGKALSYCTILIISKTLKTAPEGCLLVNSFEEAVKLAQKESGEVLVAGGQEIYQQALPLATTIYATEINFSYEGDRAFPEINKKEWTRTVETEKTENGISYEYVTYRRK